MKDRYRFVLTTRGAGYAITPTVLKMLKWSVGNWALMLKVITASVCTLSTLVVARDRGGSMITYSIHCISGSY